MRKNKKYDWVVLVFFAVFFGRNALAEEPFLYLPFNTPDAVITCNFRCCGFYRNCNHQAIDYDLLGNPQEVPVYAAAGGIVTRRIDGKKNTYPYSNLPHPFGNEIRILHSNGYITIYAHLKIGTLDVDIEEGDEVQPGQFLALMNNSGYSRGDHLHFEVRDPNGRKVNPYGDNPRYPNCGPNALWVTCPPRLYEPPADEDSDGYTTENGDCDDNDPAVNPSQTEVCNGKDDNCDGDTDEGLFNACGQCGRVPQERCNYIDDDCDGEIDEDFSIEALGPVRGLGQTCILNPYGCPSEGTVVCSFDGLVTLCHADPIEPELEVCDGIDNDCDGKIDEGLLNSCGECGSEPVELCNGRDDDCDGEKDEDFGTEILGPARGLGASCSIGYGECRGQGEMVCAFDGQSTVCGAREGAAAQEVCDGEDNDCDNQTDEDFPLLNQTCVVGQGECQREGIWVCNPSDETTIFCSLAPGQPTEELCDGLDNNCNGQTDEELTQPCGEATGECEPGTQTCVQGFWTECLGGRSPEPEICDGKDNDCDSQIDNGVLNACGECGPVSEERCNNQDDDCDGEIDEDWKNRGLASDLGQPCTVGWGICAVQSEMICTADGRATVCSAADQIVQPQPEKCDGQDNNCDGQIDEGGICGLALSPWPTLRHDNQRTGRTLLLGPNLPRLLWRFQTNAGITSSPVIAADGTIYIGSQDDYLYALNPDGTPRWQFKTQGDVGTAVVRQDGHIFLGGGYKIYLLDQDGQLEWQRDIDSFPEQHSPLLDPQGIIYYVGSNWAADEILYAFNQAGEELWHYPFTASVIAYSSPTLDEDGLVWQASGKRLYRFSSQGFIGYWSWDISAPFSSTAVLEDGFFYVGTWFYDYFLCRIEKATGNLTYTTLNYDIDAAPIVGQDGTIYAGTNSSSARFYAFVQNLIKKWEVPIGAVAGSPIIDNTGIIYVPGGRSLIAFNPDGSEKWRYTTGAAILSSPAIGEGRTIYFGSLDGYVYAIGE